MTAGPESSSQSGVEPQTPAAGDEAFLDDVFDAISTEVAAGNAPDPEVWVAQRPHLADEVARVVRLASDVWMTGAVAEAAIPGYEIVRELGSGGMGSVYLARQEALAGRLVALKIMPHAAALSQRARARFQNEAAALARIRHPNVIDIYDVVDLDATPAFAMEWVDGSTLFDLVELWVAAGSQTTSAAFAQALGSQLLDGRAATAVARWGVQVARALAAAHAEGLLHRDVKPTNIMVRRDGTALLSDFGLVRDEDSAMLTRSGAFLGTPAYAAPEQLRGDDVDERSDVYALGATLYHALVGVAPFGKARNAEILEAIESGRVQALRHRNPAVSRDLATIVETAMDADPARRYATAASLGDDLQRFLDGQPIHARPAGVFVKLGKYARRNRASFFGALIGGAAAIAVAVSIGIYLVQQARIPEQVAEHVRAARLALLDPTMDERMEVMLRQPTHEMWERPPSDGFGPALERFDAALALAEGPDLRAERETVVLAGALLAQEPLSDALEHLAPTTLTTARRWRVDAVPEVDPAVLAQASLRDRRCLGLLASLCSADALCIDAWRGLDLAAVPDPLVDAALGQLYRQRGQPALAWPRLERAFAHFHEAWFLGTAIAEVALACGDPVYSLRVSDRDTELRDYGYDSATRVRADALFALGRRAEARELYERHAARGNVPPSSHDSLARFFTATGEFERATHHHWRLALRWPNAARAARLAATLETWWGALDEGARDDLLAASRVTPGSFLDQLAYAGELGALSECPRVRALAERLELDTAKLMDWRDEPLPRLADPPALRNAGLEILSLGADGGPANGAATRPTLSADARFVAFVSAADNLVAGDANGVSDVFLHDRRTGVTARVSSRPDGGAADGPSRRPVLSADGGWVAFLSRAGDLVPGDRNGDWDCFLCDRETAAMQCVSVDEAGVPCGVGEFGSSAQPTLSSDGRRLAFVRGRVARGSVVVVWDRDRGRSTWSTPQSPKGGTGATMELERSGRRLFATTTMATLIEPDVNAWTSDVLAFEVGGTRCVRLSEVGGRQADLECQFAGISADARWLLLRTKASNLVTIDNPSEWNLLLRDNTTGAAVRLNAAGARGLPLADGSTTNGGRTAFVVRDAGIEQVWLHDVAGNSLRIASCTAAGAAGDGPSGQPALSEDGGFLVFSTAATNLMPAAPGAAPQVVGLPLPR